jgi:hypothetical protein
VVEDFYFNEVIGVQNLIMTVFAINAIYKNEVIRYLHVVAVDSMFYLLATVIKYLMENEGNGAIIRSSDLFYNDHPTWFVM